MDKETAKKIFDELKRKNEGNFKDGIPLKYFLMAAEDDSDWLFTGWFLERMGEWKRLGEFLGWLNDEYGIVYFDGMGEQTKAWDTLPILALTDPTTLPEKIAEFLDDTRHTKEVAND